MLLYLKFIRISLILQLEIPKSSIQIPSDYKANTGTYEITGITMNKAPLHWRKRFVSEYDLVTLLSLLHAFHIGSKYNLCCCESCSSLCCIERMMFVRIYVWVYNLKVFYGYLLKCQCGFFVWINENCTNVQSLILIILWLLKFV